MNYLSPGTLLYTQHPIMAGSVKGSSEYSVVPWVELGMGVVALTNWKWVEIKAIKTYAAVIPVL